MSSKMLTVVFALVVVTTSFWYTNAAEAQKIITDGLVSFWTFDESDMEGDIVKDVWGSNHGAAAKCNIVEGKIGNGMEFDGSNDRVNCGNDESLNLTDALTIELWMQPTAAGEGGPNAGPICKAEAAVDWSWQLRYNAPGGFMGFQYNADPGGSTWVSVQENLSPDEWYHIAGTFDGSEIKCYLNGEVKGTGRMSAIKGGNGCLLIGEDGWVNVFVGIVDEVRIYNRALSEDEIQHNYKTMSQLAVKPADKLAITWGRIKAED